jgi:hypothetical protein
MILETVTKIYEEEFNRFIGYRVTNSQNNQVTFVPNNVNKFRLPSNNGVDSSRKHCD